VSHQYLILWVTSLEENLEKESLCGWNCNMHHKLEGVEELEEMDLHKD
jgi:hypothetical protein